MKKEDIIMNLDVDTFCMYEYLVRFYLNRLASKSLRGGFFFVTIDEMERESGMKGWKQRERIKTLVKAGLIECKVSGFLKKRWVRIIKDVE